MAVCLGRKSLIEYQSTSKNYFFLNIPASSLAQAISSLRKRTVAKLPAQAGRELLERTHAAAPLSCASGAGI